MLDLRLLLVGASVMAAASAAGGAAAARAGLSRTVGADSAMAGLAWFIVAARVTWVGGHPGSMFYPYDVIRITQGLNTAGGIIGAVAAVLVVAARRGVDWRRLAGPATVSAMAAAATWHATCFAHQRCGGIYAPPPFGLPMGGRGNQIPVAGLLALTAAVLGWWSWRGTRAKSAAQVGRPAACAAIFIATLSLSGAIQLRLDPWPAATDVALAVLAVLFGGLAVIAYWGRTIRRTTATTPPPEGPEEGDYLVPTLTFVERSNKTIL